MQQNRLGNQVVSQPSSQYLPVTGQSMMFNAAAPGATDIPDSLLTSGLTESDLTSFLESHKNIASLTEDILAHLTAPCKESDDLASASTNGDRVEGVRSKVEVDPPRNEVVDISTSMTAEQISTACKGKGEKYT